MPSFGFSAFLKLISLNDRPQRTQMRERLQPTGDGYDFHRSLRLRVNRFLVQGEQIEGIISSLSSITKDAERNSVRAGLLALAEWRRAHPGEICELPPATYESPDKSFKVHFTPDFGVIANGKKVAVHVWNTKHPTLSPRFIYGALTLFPPVYAEIGDAPDDLAVLSLRDGRLYRLSVAADHTSLGRTLVAGVEALIRSVNTELGLPSEPRGDRPSAPPPPPPA